MKHVRGLCRVGGRKTLARGNGGDIRGERRRRLAEETEGMERRGGLDDE